MNLKAFIESGILEMYCMGLTSDEERRMVEQLAAEYPDVRTELEETEHLYLSYSKQQEPGGIFKPHVWEAIEKAIILPPLLTETSDVGFWMEFTENVRSGFPERGPIRQLFLPGDQNLITYLVKADAGAIVEEMHDDSDEMLLMLQGSCSITTHGQTRIYHEGDLICIPKNTMHKAVSLTDNMLLVGQQIAA